MGGLVAYEAPNTVSSYLLADLFSAGLVVSPSLGQCFCGDSKTLLSVSAGMLSSGRVARGVVDSEPNQTGYGPWFACNLFTTVAAIVICGGFAF